MLEVPGLELHALNRKTIAVARNLAQPDSCGTADGLSSSVVIIAPLW
jgi:hypothetical protein